MTEISSLRLKQAALERENYDLKDRFGGAELDMRLWGKPPLGPVAGHMRSPSPTLHLHQNGYAENGHRSRLGSAGSGDGGSAAIKPLSRPRVRVG